MQALYLQDTQISGFYLTLSHIWLFAHLIIKEPKKQYSNTFITHFWLDLLQKQVNLQIHCTMVRLDQVKVKIFHLFIICQTFIFHPFPNKGYY